MATLLQGGSSLLNLNTRAAKFGDESLPENFPSVNPSQPHMTADHREGCLLYADLAVECSISMTAATGGQCDTMTRLFF